MKEFLRSVGAKTAAELSGQDPSRLRSLDDKHLDEVRVYVEGVFGTSEERSFRKIVTASFGIAVHVIKPKSPQGFLTLFTTGLSAKPMKVPPELAEHAFAELYMQLPGDWDFQSSDPRYSWPIQLLLDLAAYPAENDAYFAVPVTTIANGEPAKPLGPNVKFTASALLADEGFQRSKTWKDRASSWYAGLRGRSGKSARRLNLGLLEGTGCIRHESNPDR